MVDKVLLRRILTDPKLRLRLASDPAAVLGVKLTLAEITTIKRILTQTKSVEDMISTLSTEILCTGPGTCGIK